MHTGEVWEIKTRFQKSTNQTTVHQNAYIMTKKNKKVSIWCVAGTRGGRRAHLGGSAQEGDLWVGDHAGGERRAWPHCCYCVTMHARQGESQAQEDTPPNTHTLSHSRSILQLREQTFSLRCQAKVWKGTAGASRK